MTNINGLFQRQTIQDTRGATDNSVGGFGNTITFRGDKGANSFNIGGQSNSVDVNNLGRDDRVNLQGPGWQEMPDANAKDGVLRFYNSITGSFAEVKTDAGRDDAFVRARVSGANGQPTPQQPHQCSCHNPWSMLGQLDPMQSAYLQGYAAGQQSGQQNGYRHGFEDGDRHGRSHNNFSFGNWLAQLALGPMAWFR